MMMTNRIRAAVALLALACSSAPALGQAADPFAPPAPPAAEDVRMFKFPDGSLLFGAIESHDADGFEVVRVDTGGHVRLGWGMLTKEQADALRTDLGYVEIEAAEVYVQGERLLLDGGGSVTGVVLSREGDHFLVKSDGNVQRLPKVRVRSIETGVRIPALDVYSQDEMYARMLAEADLASPKGHIALAERSEGILDFRHAAEHYAAALEMGLEGDEASRVEGALARSEVKAEAQDQLDVLRSADKQRRLGNYDEALAIVRAFPAQFAGSALIEDARKAEKKLEDARDDAAQDLVEKRWTFWAKRLTRQKATEDGTFEEMRAWAADTLSNEIQQRVHADLVERVSETYQVEDVRTLWDRRDSTRWTSATYGMAGTWLLGTAGAQAGLEDDGRNERAAVSAADEQRRAIEDRMRRYIENQRRSRRSASGGASEVEQENEFWRTWSGAGRSLWLLAYYAENGGDYVLRDKPSLRACPRCAGEGAIPVMAAGTLGRGELSAVQACPLCHSVQVVRRVHFR